MKYLTVNVQQDTQDQMVAHALLVLQGNIKLMPVRLLARLVQLTRSMLTALQLIIVRALPVQQTVKVWRVVDSPQIVSVLLVGLVQMVVPVLIVQLEHTKIALEVHHVAVARQIQQPRAAPPMLFFMPACAMRCTQVLMVGHVLVAL